MPSGSGTSSGLHRELGLWEATSLNIANMIGIGPFITIPAFISAMNGPQAMIAWVVAAVLVIADGLVWSELGAAFPGSGGSYHFLREIYGRYRWGRVIPFLFIWQFLISGALEMASGYIGGLKYLYYLIPSLESWSIPGGPRWLAAGGALLVTLILFQPIRRLGLFSVLLCAGSLITVAIVIVSGWMHFDASLLKLPPDAFQFNGGFAKGLGAAMLIAIYDYLGYFNVCHLGDEVKNPARTIPRAVMISIVVVAAIYLTMNLAIIGVVPWEEAMKSQNIAALFMERIYGRTAAMVLTCLILWTCTACMFAITLGYSRIPYAAAVRGDFFSIFAKVHPTNRYPWVSLAVLGALTAVFCFFELEDVITAAVGVRILVQFVGQIVGLLLLRRQLAPETFPFRMWFFPLPCFVALAGWIFVFAMAKPLIIAASGGVIVSGVVFFGAWSYCRSR